MNIFLGSMEWVLELMSRHLDVDLVIAPRGRLRNMRLEKRLRDGGTRWLTIDDAAQYRELIAGLQGINLCVVAGFSRRIDQATIDRCERIINFHPGDLLCCRGPQPLESALLAGHTQLGVCAHLIDSETMDAGPIVARSLFDVRPERGYQWHHSELQQHIAEVATVVFSTIAGGEPLPTRDWDVEASQWFERPPADELKRLYSAPSLARFYGAGDFIR